MSKWHSVTNEVWYRLGDAVFDYMGVSPFRGGRYMQALCQLNPADDVCTAVTEDLNAGYL